MAYFYINNIFCVSSDRTFLDAIGNTLDRIKEKAPKDYDRLVGLVLAIVVCEMDEGGPSGEWMRAVRLKEHRKAQGLETLGSLGFVLLNKDLPPDRRIGVVAHELGHAATIFSDLTRRGPVSDEWKHELTADWYACKWGFGREIARLRKPRNIDHNCAGPGQIIQEFVDGEVCCYKVTRNLVARLVGTTEGYFTLNWIKFEHAVRAYLNPDEPIDVDLIHIGLEKATLVGDCSQDQGFWMLDQNGGVKNGHFKAYRVKFDGSNLSFQCPTQYPLRKPEVDQPGSEILGAIVSIRLKDSEYPAIGEYLLVLHRNVFVGEQEKSGSSSVVLTWVSAKTGKVCQSEICSSEAWFTEDGALVAAYAEILDTVEGNGVRIRLHAPVPQKDGTDSVQVYYPPEKEV